MTYWEKNLPLVSGKLLSFAEVCILALEFFLFKFFNRTQLNHVHLVDSWEIEFLKSWAIICFKHLMTRQSLKASRTKKKGTTDQNNYQHFLKSTNGHSHMHKNTRIRASH